MNKQDLVSKLKQLEGLTPDERAYLTNLINTKKYGLVWEDKPEDAEELLRTHLPVLREVAERRITASPSPSTIATPPQPSPEGRESAKTENVANKQAMKPESNTTQTSLFEVDAETNNEQITNIQNEQLLEQPNLPPLGGGLGRGVSYGEGRGRVPNHILIEGDNLHALTALTFTHEGKVDVMYFDPPYNTGNKDFKYNDSFVDKEDSYRHSKWLSFMHKRLEIAKRLLSDKGVIFISIDDNEIFQLKLLADEVFNDENFICNFIRKCKAGGGHDSKEISIEYDYMLFYSKNRNSVRVAMEYIDVESDSKYKLKDEYISKRGKYYLRDLDYKGSYSESSDYPIQLKNGRQIYAGGKFGKPNTWRWSKSKFEWGLENGFIVIDNEKEKVYIKQYQYVDNEDNIRERKLPYRALINYLNSDGSQEIRNVVDQNIFTYPKPTSLVKFCLNLSEDKKITILDIFAGSGTTLHATMQLNAEDGGNRQCILVTNNENNICEEVTYERNKRVIQGYTNAKGVPVAGLANNNLRYYRTEFVGRERSLKNKRLLVQAATQMLCVKEDIYSELTEVAGETIDKNNYRCFVDNDRYLLVIYNEEVIEELVPLIAKIESKHKIKIYVFAPGQYPYTEEFEDVLPKVELCALPDAIYKAYANVLPKKTAKNNVEKEHELDWPLGHS